jgi:DNA (cytosine-5)-methyltransferase 1
LSRGLSTVGLFAGIGGLELGLQRAGHHPILLADNYPPAMQVLRSRFAETKILGDVRDLRSLPEATELLVAGFPCQDFSSVGLKAGIEGTKSNVVSEVFRLLRRRRVPWVVLENVPFLLQLHRGAAMNFLIREFARLGYAWAYRVIDSEAFGVPQRRRRLFLVASTEHDPRDVLFGSEVDRPPIPDHTEVACGFYWTEGMRALGWAVDGVPPIKGGSALGVPSPPAILFPQGSVGTPDIRDAERLQGFPVDWSRPAEEVARAGFRWKLIGNAVTVPVSQWLGERLIKRTPYRAELDRELGEDQPFPSAAWALWDRQRYAVPLGPWPVWQQRPHLREFLRYPLKPLSAQAVDGFLKRTKRGSLRFPEGFLEKLVSYARQLAA